MTGSVKNQYLVTVCANIFTLGYGATIGWPSAALTILQSDESPLEVGPISGDEASWIGSIMCIGGLIGNIFFGWLSNKIGRKRTLMLAAFVMVLALLMVPFSQNVIYLCVSRFLSGFSGSAALGIIPIYIAEIADDSVRGSLGSQLIMFCNIGTLFAFVFGAFFSYYLSSLLLVAFPIAFLCLIVFFPDSPLQLLRLGKEEEALKSYKFYKNVKKDTDEFLLEFQKFKGQLAPADKDDDSGGISLKDFTNPTARKGLTIGIVLMFLNQFSGIFAILNYTAFIFKQAGSSLSPNVSAIIIGFIQVMGSYVANLLIEKAGRKILYLLSCIGSGLGLQVLGLYVYLSSNGYDCSDYKWVPIGCFSLFIFSVQLAISSLPFLVISEILAPKIRSIGNNICVSLLWILSFSVLKALPMLIAMFHLHGAMMIFGICCFLGGIYVIIFLPETKGRSIEEILVLLK